MLVSGDVEPIRIDDDDGTLLVRDAVLLAFFCRRPFHEMSEGVREALSLWRGVLPEETLAWALVGANATRYEPLIENTIDQCSSMLDPKKAVQREITAFDLRGPEKYNPAWQFFAVGHRELVDNDDLAESNLVEMRFPADWLVERGAAWFVDLAVRIAGCLPFDSGYASPALCWSAECRRPAAGTVIAPLALRHPGFDVHDNDTTRFRIGLRSRGARWLTFLGGLLVADLGGTAALREALDPEVQLSDVHGAVMLRAGEAPDVGDVNRRENLPLLCSVAAAIESVTLFEDHGLTVLLANDPEKLDRWERRFFPQGEDEND